MYYSALYNEMVSRGIDNIINFEIGVILFLLAEGISS